MKAIISTTYSNTYLYFLPIVTFCWNKLGVDVICFMPSGRTTIKNGRNILQGVYPDGNKKMYLINETIKKNKGNLSIHCFSAPEHKEATYAQCSRLYGACLDLPEDEVLITGDVDMAVFKLPEISNYFPTIVGADLVPDGQYPMCYASMTVKDWRLVTRSNGKTYQQCLDEELGDLEAEQFRGNFWSRDQELLYKKLNGTSQVSFPAPIPKTLVNRSNGQNQFAQNRYDRDDIFILDRLNPDTIDFHMNRPGYEEKNFEIILTILKYHFPDESFDWLISYTNAYKELL